MSYSAVKYNISEEIKDIFLSKEYYMLSEMNAEGLFEYFSFSDGERFALYPFLKNEILGFESIPSGGFFDIQSAYGYGGVITNCYDENFIDGFFQEFDKFCKENNVVAEFVRFHPLLENDKFSSFGMEIIDDRQTVIIDLSLDYEEIFTTQYSSKGRNVIRKGRKLGYHSEFILNPDRDLIEKFHEIYSENMRSVNADEYYFFSLDYFLELFRRLKDSASLGVITNQEGDILCASIFLHHFKFFHYHLSGRVRGADNSVNNFMIDEAVKYGISCGATKFHLGGGLSNDENDRLFKFKSSFSKDRGMFKIGKRVHNCEVYDKLVQEWEEKNPDKAEAYSNYLLKYRF